jgi:hypothetical protein
MEGRREQIYLKLFLIVEAQFKCRTAYSISIDTSISQSPGCIWRKANMFVGAKHDRIKYEIITNNLSAVMLRPLLKSEMHTIPQSKNCTAK